MGHLAGKHIYRQLGNKIDQLTMRAPWNEALYALLKELYTQEEAELLVEMPSGMSTLSGIAHCTGRDEAPLRAILDSLCAKGLIIDFWIGEEYHYMISPMVIGIFEFTMMRTGEHLRTKEWARLLHDYLDGDDTFIAANYGHREQVSLMRTLPHERAFGPSEYAEVLDYEKASAIVEEADTFSVGICSCRHEKFHLEQKTCNVPLETCTSFGRAAEYLLRHNLAREISKTEMLEQLARSQEQGLVLNGDNVQRNIAYICHCCTCCCNLLSGINKHGYPNIVVTSSFLAALDSVACSGCGKCAQACPVHAFTMKPVTHPVSKKRQLPEFNESLCLGCGVCVTTCPANAIQFVKRAQRVLHPATIFERVILQALEKGTLQNQIFNNPHSFTHTMMRGILGGFVRLPPVKRALMSDMLRSTFLSSLKVGVKMMGKGWVLDM